MTVVLMWGACSQSPNGPILGPGESSEAYVNDDVKMDGLKGTEVVLDTALFRYAYRMRVYGNIAVIFDLHNAEYYYHTFSYPEMEYKASFGRRGQGPDEMMSAEGMRFDSEGMLWTWDIGRLEMRRYSIDDQGLPRLEQLVHLSDTLLRPMDFVLVDDNTAVMPDYTGQARLGWMSLKSGKLIKKWERIPTDKMELLRNNGPAVAEGWNSFMGISPDKDVIAMGTQMGDRMDIYNLRTGKHIVAEQSGEQPAFHPFEEGWSAPSGGLYYFDTQVTKDHIYAVIDGRTREEGMEKGSDYRQGGKRVRVYDHQGNLQNTLLLDRRIAGLFVDEEAGILYGLDVNADEQIVRYDLRQQIGD